MLLDLLLPGGSGFELLARWRRDGSTVPVIVITVRTALEDRLAGLDGGADDFVLKPVAPGAGAEPGAVVPKSRLAQRLEPLGGALDIDQPRLRLVGAAQPFAADALQLQGALQAAAEVQVVFDEQEVHGAGVVARLPEAQPKTAVETGLRARPRAAALPRARADEKHTERHRSIEGRLWAADAGRGFQALAARGHPARQSSWSCSPCTALGGVCGRLAAGVSGGVLAGAPGAVPDGAGWRASMAASVGASGASMDA